MEKINSFPIFDFAHGEPRVAGTKAATVSSFNPSHDPKDKEAAIGLKQD